MSIQAEGVALDALTTDPVGADDGQIWYRSILGEPRAQRQGAAQTLLTPPSHEGLDQLAHVAAENGVTEDTFDADGCLLSRTIRTAPSPAGVAIRTWDSYTFDADGCLTGYRVRQFGPTGLAVQTLTVSRPGGVWTSVLS
jgi:hypothetical protein